MIDDIKGMALTDLASLLEGQVEGDGGVRISSAAGLEDAVSGSIVRVEHARYLRAALDGPASALLLAPGLDAVGKPCVRVQNPRAAFARCLEILYPQSPPEPGIHSTAVIGGGAA